MPSNNTGNEQNKSDEASKNVATGSRPQQEDQKSNSVFDFLYHDHRRIASFLAQFETYGVLQQIKATEYAAQLESTKSGVSGLLSAGIAKTGSTQDVTTGSEERDTAERTYDPILTNARTLLNFLAERDMIVRDLPSARIGQFVLITGDLAAFDLGILKQAWQLPAVKLVLENEFKKATAAQQQSESQGNRKERQKAKYEQKQAAQSELAGALELLTIMPHTVQATIAGRLADGQEWWVWSSLREDSLNVSGGELLLKHGVAIPGQWSMLGVLDAMPHVAEDAMQLHMLEQIVGASSLGGIASQFAANLGPAVRLMLGRPSTAYGMTPLLVFREVSG